MIKHKSSIFTVIAITILGLFSQNCNQTQADENENLPIKKQGFVQLENGSFTLNDSGFYPMMLNYKIEIRNIDGQAVVSPAIYYEKPLEYETNTKEAIQNQLEAHFQLMSELGFNTVRICADVINNDEQGYYYPCSEKKYLIADSAEIYSAFDEMFETANKHNLKVMLLIKFPLDKEIERFTIGLLQHNKENTSILAYDFMNEPLYFDPAEKRDKIDAKEIVGRWHDLVRTHAPYHLFTIGFSEPIEVFEWDPALLPVDFVQIHTYHPLRVKNEIWWYSKYVGKPFMIGETSLPANNDSISYDLQRTFMKELYQYSLSCGSIGFGWWEFQDNDYGTVYEHIYSGLLNLEGTTTTADGKHTIVGTLKPAAQEVKNLKNITKQQVERPENYFNIVGYNNIVIRGKILNYKTQEPIEGAVVRGWNECWSVGMNTFTNEKGEFTLYSNDECVHFEISAPRKTKIKFDKKLDYKQLASDYNFDNLPNRMLEYQKISHFPFVKDANKPFDFKVEMFNKAKFEGDMGVLYLEEIE